MRRLALAFALLPAAAVAGAAAGGLAVMPAHARGGGAGGGGDGASVRLLDARAVRGAARRGGDRDEAARRQCLLAASANMSFERELDFKVGNGLFRKLWVTAPASTRCRTGSGRSSTRARASPAT